MSTKEINETNETKSASNTAEGSANEAQATVAPTVSALPAAAIFKQEWSGSTKKNLVKDIVSKMGFNDHEITEGQGITLGHDSVFGQTSVYSDTPTNNVPNDSGITPDDTGFVVFWSLICGTSSADITKMMDSFVIHSRIAEFRAEVREEYFAKFRENASVLLDLCVDLDKVLTISDIIDTISAKAETPITDLAEGYTADTTNNITSDTVQLVDAARDFALAADYSDGHNTQFANDSVSMAQFDHKIQNSPENYLYITRKNLKANGKKILSVLFQGINFAEQAKSGSLESLPMSQYNPHTGDTLNLAGIVPNNKIVAIEKGAFHYASNFKLTGDNLYVNSLRKYTWQYNRYNVASAPTASCFMFTCPALTADITMPVQDSSK